MSARVFLTIRARPRFQVGDIIDVAPGQSPRSAAESPQTWADAGKSGPFPGGDWRACLHVDGMPADANLADGSIEADPDDPTGQKTRQALKKTWWVNVNALPPTTRAGLRGPSGEGSCTEAEFLAAVRNRSNGRLHPGYTDPEDRPADGGRRRVRIEKTSERARFERERPLSIRGSG